MTRPNFFIVGAPKCGTTALSDYLREHPQVFMSWPKEPGYFCSDLDAPIHQVRTERRYLDLFRQTGPDVRVVGEASASYILSKVAIPRILEFAPEARMLLMLRNPVDMAYSWHGELLWSLDEELDDFRQAWGLQAERKLGRGVPRRCRMPEMLQYADVARMAARVEALLTHAPRDRVKIVLMDDFARQPGDVYREVLRFLSVSDDRRREFPRVNANKRVDPALSWLARVNQRPPRILRDAVRLAKRLLGREQQQLLTPIYRKEIARPPLDRDFRTELQEVFRADVETLSGLIDRDLSPWLAGSSLPPPPSSERA